MSCEIVDNFSSCKTGGFIWSWISRAVRLLGISGGFIWSCEIGGREKEADSKAGDCDQHLKLGKEGGRMMMINPGTLESGTP